LHAQRAKSLNRKAALPAFGALLRALCLPAQATTGGPVAGQAVAYTMTVSSSVADAGNVLVTDQQPAGVSFHSWNCTSAPDGLCPAASGGGGDFSQTIARLPVGQSVTFTINGTVDAPSDPTVNIADVNVPGGQCASGKPMPCQKITTTGALVRERDLPYATPVPTLNAAALTLLALLLAALDWRARRKPGEKAGL
jgi:uncharacterized repeat protein (TIGR01451 family)